MDTKKLRQKILDLAIRGKLVPQDPNDEPASVLLERIRAEKERLIKEGKIKRSKKSAKSSDTPHYENIDFALPENWQLSTLGEVFYMHAGKNIVASEISPNADETYRYKCIGGNGLRGYVQQFNTEGSFPIIGRQGALCGNINYVEGRFYATEHAVVVDTFCETNVKWAFYFLIQLNLNQYATATAQPGLSVNTIGDVQIPIPPKEEQCRIVSYIEQCFRTIDTLERGKDELEENIKNTKSKILDLAIHGKLVPQDPNDEPAIDLLRRINPSFVPCDNAHYENMPDSWCVVSLGNICALNEGKPITNKEYSYIDVKGLRTGNYASKQSGKYVPAGTTLILVDGENSGEVFHTPVEGFQGSTMKVLEIDSEMNAQYVLYFVKLYQKALRENKVGSAIPHLNKKMFRELIIPIPTKEEKERIVEAIQQHYRILDNISANL